jgi:hypothetical protein
MNWLFVIFFTTVEWGPTLSAERKVSAKSPDFARAIPALDLLKTVKERVLRRMNFTLEIAWVWWAIYLLAIFSFYVLLRIVGHCGTPKPDFDTGAHLSGIYLSVTVVRLRL